MSNMRAMLQKKTRYIEILTHPYRDPYLTTMDSMESKTYSPENERMVPPNMCQFKRQGKKSSNQYFSVLHSLVFRDGSNNMPRIDSTSSI